MLGLHSAVQSSETLLRSGLPWGQRYAVKPAPYILDSLSLALGPVFPVTDQGRQDVGYTLGCPWVLGCTLDTRFHP